MLIDVGKADTHDMSDIEALDAHFAKRRDDELAASMAAERSKIDVARSAARATVIKRAGVATLLGGVGLGAALFGASFLVTPRVHFTDVDVPRISMRDVTVDRVIPHDVPVQNVVPHETVIEVPRIVVKDTPAPPPKAADPGPSADASPAPRNPAEKKFEATPGWKESVVKGRIVRSDKNGFILTTEDGETSFYPANVRPDGTVEDVPSMRDDVSGFIGDLTFCREQPQRANKPFFACSVLLPDGTETTIKQVPIGFPAPPSGLSSRSCPPSKSGLPVLECGTPPAPEMITTLVDVNGFDVRAMIDTGNSSGMSIPKKLADQLVRLNRADRGASSQTTLADGSTENVETITIHYITVDQRVLHDVAASVSPNDEAPVLLGLGALNRLGPYHFTDDGRIVFTGAPA
jgi:hypothetical protein